MVSANINYTKHECFQINVEVSMLPLQSPCTFQTLNYCSDYAIEKIKSWSQFARRHSESPISGQAVYWTEDGANHSEKADNEGRLFNIPPAAQSSPWTSKYQQI